ncbi:MAG: CoA-binding protein [Candidatus Sumerlaeia bacterium]|nr:CoA-binding protein [Candidatus Sumerlaeia bacterium]
MAPSIEEVVTTTLGLRRWAVVGASPNTERASYRVVKLLTERGFDVFPVRPALEAIDGIKVYPRLSDVPHPVDVVDMVVNPAVGIKVMEEVRARGIRYVWLQPGSESEEIHAFAREHGIEAIEACVLAVLAIRRQVRHG